MKLNVWTLWLGVTVVSAIACAVVTGNLLGLGAGAVLGALFAPLLGIAYFLLYGAVSWLGAILTWLGQKMGAGMGHIHG